MPTGATWQANSPIYQPGVYVRFRRRDTSLPFPRARVVGVVLRASFGPLNAPTEIETLQDLEATFGAGGTVDAARQALIGGAATALVVRQGTGGTKASLSVSDAVPAASVRLDATGVGVDGSLLTATIRASFSSGFKELLVYKAGALRQTIPFATGGVEADNLVAAVNASGSPWITAARLAGVGLVIPAITNQALAGGADPTYDGTSFSNALAALAPTAIDSVITESEAPADHATLLAWLNQQWGGGQRTVAFVGEPTGVAAATRRSDASALNSEKMVYVGNGFKLADGSMVEGYRAAAWLAGREARLDYMDTLTSVPVDGAVSVVGAFSSVDVDKAINAGMLVFRVAPEGGVEVTYDRTTLVTATGDLDDGWKNLQRVRVRVTFVDRSALASYALRSRVKNDADGRATLRQAIQGVADAMVRERALRSDPYPVISDDPDNPPSGDRYYFVADCDDLPPINVVLGTYDWRFTPPATAAA